MPIYMDRHDVPPGISFTQAIEAHEKDQDVQEKYGCIAKTFWYDQQRCASFCLIEAPNKSAVKKMHNEAHGMVPNQIIEVNMDVVETFMGKIQDPESEDEIESAFRVIMFTDLKDSVEITGNYGDQRAMDLIRVHNSIIRQNIKQYKGRDVKHTGDGFMVSFSSVSKAVDCSIAIQKAFAAYNDKNQEIPMKIRIGLNAGEPVTESGDLFGATIQLASRICDYTEAGKILASSVIPELCLGKSISFIDRGEISLKGFEANTHVYEINWKS